MNFQDYYLERFKTSMKKTKIQWLSERMCESYFDAPDDSYALNVILTI